MKLLPRQGTNAYEWAAVPFKTYGRFDYCDFCYEHLGWRSGETEELIERHYYDDFAVCASCKEDPPRADYEAERARERARGIWPT